MKQEYDFSHAERGKFRADGPLSLPASRSDGPRALSNPSRFWMFLPTQTISSLARILIIVGALPVEVMTVNATGAVFDVLRARKWPKGEYQWLLADIDAPVHPGLEVVLGKRDKPGGLAVRITEVTMRDDGLLCKGAGW